MEEFIQSKINMDQEIVIGIRPLIEAIKSGKEISRIFLKKGLTGNQINELFQLLHAHRITYQQVPIERLNRITQKNHQGVVAYLSPITFYEPEQIIPAIFEQGKNPIILVLDRITDVRNFGAICRSAECSGIDCVIIGEKGSALIGFDAMKTSAGALNYLPICKVNNLEKSVRYLKNSGLKIFGASEKASLNFLQADFQQPVALILGSEESGISAELLRLCDEIVKIPVFGKIASLNVSVAAAILMYEVIRQRTEI